MKVVGFAIFVLSLLSLPIVIIIAFFVSLQTQSLMLSGDALVMSIGSLLMNSEYRRPIKKIKE